MLSLHLPQTCLNFHFHFHCFSFLSFSQISLGHLGGPHLCWISSSVHVMARWWFLYLTPCRHKPHMNAHVARIINSKPPCQWDRQLTMISSGYVGCESDAATGSNLENESHALSTRLFYKNHISTFEFHRFLKRQCLDPRNLILFLKFSFQ